MPACRLPSAQLNGLVREWMGAWGCLAGSRGWDTLWLALLSRVAKHDWKGGLKS